MAPNVIPMPTDRVISCQMRNTWIICYESIESGLVKVNLQKTVINLYYKFYNTDLSRRDSVRFMHISYSLTVTIIV